jgi:hypothetical protein
VEVVFISEEIDLGTEGEGEKGPGGDEFRDD